MEWETFTFYYGQMVGYRRHNGWAMMEIIPVNGRSEAWEVREDGEWVGETFPSVEEAKKWVDHE